MADIRTALSIVALSVAMATAPALAQDSGTGDAGEAPTEQTEPTTPDTAPETTEPAAEEAPAASGSYLSLGQEAADPNAPGTTYTMEEHGDWQVRCVRTKDGDDPCQLYQLLKDKEGNSVAEFSMFALPEGEQAAAGATIAVPLETLLTQAITLSIDDGQAKRYPFSWCSQIGCFARVGFTAPEVAAFKAGKQATVTIVPVVAPDQQVDLTVSLSGFTAGYDAVKAINAE